MAAEWRPDPFGRAELRYFDGTGWTHHIASAGQQAMESTDLPIAGAPDPSAFAPRNHHPRWVSGRGRAGRRREGVRIGSACDREIG